VRSPPLTRRGLASVAAGIVTAVCASSCASTVLTTGGSQSSTVGAGAAPLATSIDAAGGTWATVAMGQLDQPDNTFWQLLFRPTGATSWTNKIEATAVATNGGVLITPSQGRSLLAGVRPSGFLTFSPLIATVDGGQSWTNGLLPGGLVASPDALAANASGSSLAITGTGSSLSSESVVTAGAHSLTNWQTLTSAGDLAASTGGGQCGPTALTAVAFNGSDPVVGARCDRAGVVGLFERKGGAWTLAGPHLPASADGDQVSVVALQSSSDGLSGLVSAFGAGGTAVMAISTDDLGQSWQVSQPLQLTPSEQLTSVGPVGAGGFFVLLSSSSGPDRAVLLGAPQSAWKQLPSPPPGTATLAFGPGTSVEALAVNTATLTVWTLGSTGGWHKGQMMTVSIQYGSSS
jgi:hypothetical protein